MRNKAHETDFYVFRYQISPTVTEVQTDFLAPEIKSTEDLIARKNDFFQQSLMGITNFSNPRTEVVHELLATDGIVTVMRLAVSRHLTLENKDFTTQRIENWPSILVAFANQPNVQKLFIQSNSKVFQHPGSVAKLLQDAINTKLLSKHLHVQFAPLFEKQEFWTLVRKFGAKITEAKFELITPNMSAISQTVTEDLKKLAKETNTSSTTINLESAPDANLNLDPQNENLSGLVDYASQGGGNISLTVSGFRKKVQTEKKAVTTTIDNLQLEGKDGTELLRVFKSLSES